MSYSSVAQKTPARVSNYPFDDRHLRAAQLYAHMGFYVFPAHNPVFDDAGNVTGCTCEPYRQSDQCKFGHPHLYLGPEGKCDNPGKCPRVRWRDNSTTDPDQIRKWWGHAWRDGHVPNIGIDAGKSGLLVLDADTYKDRYDGDDLDLDENTVTTLTGGGGTHVWYRQPEDGPAYGNQTGDLPDGIDIRGEGGYIIAPPSLHSSGRRYQFELEFGPHEIQIAPIPAGLQDLLETARKTAPSSSVVFSDPTTNPPDLTAWRLSADTLARISEPAPKGERSEADMSVVTALVYAGATDDDVLAVFEHNPIGTSGKYADRGLDYLARTIGNARSFVEANPRPPSWSEDLDRLRQAVKSVSFVDFVPPPTKGIYRTDTTDTKIADALLDVAERRRSWTFSAGLEEVRRLAGLGSRQTVANGIERLSGWFVEVVDAGDKRTPATYQIVKDWGGSRKMDSSHLRGPSVDTTVHSTRPPLSETYTQRKADDPFLSGRSRTAKRLGLEEPGLGETILRILDALERSGPSTRKDLGEVTGKTKSAIQRATRRAEVLALIDVDEDEDTGAKIYALAGYTWSSVEELRPTLKTYRLADERNERSLERAQVGVERLLAYHRNPVFGDPDELFNLNRRHMRITRRRLGLIPKIYPDFTPEEVQKWVFADRPKTRSYLDERIRKQDELAALGNLAGDISTQAIPYEEGRKLFTMAGYSPQDIVKAYGLSYDIKTRPAETLPPVVPATHQQERLGAIL